MEHITVIMCRSNTDGLLHINGQLSGPCGPNKPISIPWDVTTPLYLCHMPYGVSHAPLSIQLLNRDEGLMPCEGAALIVWPGVLEVILDPSPIMSGPPPLMPQDLGRRTFNTQSGTIVSTVVEYCGTWWVLESPRGTLMCQRISKELVRGNVELIAMNPAAFLFEGESFAAVAGSGSTGFSLLYSGDADVVNRTREITLREAGTPSFILSLSGDGSGIQEKRTLSTQSPSSATETAQQFLWALALEDTTYAYSMLSDGLRTVFSQDDIVDFIGKVDDVDDCRFVPTFDQTCLAVKEKQSSGVYMARPFAFDVSEDFKIENITPL